MSGSERSSSIKTDLEPGSSSGSDSGSSSETPMIPMAYNFEPSSTDSGSSSETSSDGSDLGKAAACCSNFLATTSVYLPADPKPHNSIRPFHVFASSISPAHSSKYCKNSWFSWPGYLTRSFDILPHLLMDLGLLKNTNDKKKSPLQLPFKDSKNAAIIISTQYSKIGKDFGLQVHYSLL